MTAYLTANSPRNTTARSGSTDTPVGALPQTLNSRLSTLNCSYKHHSPASICWADSIS